jgi:hypothetical protein
VIQRRRRLRESRDETVRRFDVPGQVTLIGGLFALVYGLLKTADAGWGDSTTVVALSLAGLLGIAFILVEQRGSDPNGPVLEACRAALRGRAGRGVRRPLAIGQFRRCGENRGPSSPVDEPRQRPRPTSTSATPE